MSPRTAIEAAGGLRDLVARALHHLESLGYSPGSIANYRRAWREFLQFTEEESDADAPFTVLVERFLQSRAVRGAEVFRLLYGCGMRLGEVLHLRVADVDLTAGILTVLGGKFNKDRLVPMAPSVLARLRKYAAVLGKRDPSSVFFPAPDGGP